jgi:hypothetical protein
MNGIHIGNGTAGLGGQAGSPVKESSFLHRETSIDDQEDEGAKAPEKQNSKEQSTSLPPAQKGVPIRWQS